MAPFEIVCLAKSFDKSKNKDGVLLIPNWELENSPNRKFLKASLNIDVQTRTGHTEGKVGYSITYEMSITDIPFEYFKHATNELFARCNSVLLAEYSGKALLHPLNDFELLALVNKMLTV